MGVVVVVVVVVLVVVQNLSFVDVVGVGVEVAAAVAVAAGAAGAVAVGAAVLYFLSAEHFVRTLFFAVVKTQREWKHWPTEPPVQVCGLWQWWTVAVVVHRLDFSLVRSFLGASLSLQVATLFPTLFFVLGVGGGSLRSGIFVWTF